MTDVSVEMLGFMAVGCGRTSDHSIILSILNVQLFCLETDEYLIS